jgi:hypothetical protein
MSAYVDEWNKGPRRWRYRVQFRLPDGSSKRIQGTPALNTKEAAERAEREHINRLEDAIRNPKAARKEAAPKFETFAKTFLEISVVARRDPRESGPDADGVMSSNSRSGAACGT